MWIVIICSLFALFFAYMGSKGRVKNGFELGFLIVTVIEAIHYNFGNDYMNYFSDYHEIEGSTIYWNELFNPLYYKEPGWVVLNYLASFCGGFFTLVAVLSIIQNYIYYSFIKENLPKKLWYFGFFIYVFSAFDLYLINMSMLRQGFTIALFVYCYQYIKEKKVIIPLIIILVAYTIHSSAILLLPFVFWGYLPLSKSRLYAYGVFVLFVVLMASKDILNDLLSSFQIISVLNDYTDIYVGDSAEFGIGFIIRLVPFFVYTITLCNKDIDDEKFKLIVSLACLGFLIEPFSSIGQLFVRMGYYFAAYSVVALPMSFNKLQNKGLKTIFLAAFIFITFYMYIGYFTNSAHAKKSRVYQTIFSVM